MTNQRFWTVAAIFISVCFLTAACRQQSGNPKVKNSPTLKPDVVKANMDTAIRPEDDFFQYANGAWLKANPIPPEESYWGIGNLVEQENYTRLRLINENAAKATNNKAGSAQQKIGNFWAMAMDSALVEKTGLQPIQPMLNQIDAAQNMEALTKVIAELDEWGVHPLLGYYVTQDDKNSEAMILRFTQTGIGLPDREYYFKKDSATTAIRKIYTDVIAKVLKLSGRNMADAQKAATDIMAFETAIAKSHKKIEDLRNPYTNYHKMHVTAFYKLTPTVNWQNYFEKNHLNKLDSVIVGQPEYYKNLEQLLKKADVNMLKNYLRVRVLISFAEALPNDYGTAFFELQKALQGAEQRKPRWKRTLELQDALMGELLGRLYVQKYFDEKAKERYSDLVENIKNAYKNRILQLPWMSDSTKKQALQKLAAMKKKVGYPDKWKDFSQMQIGRESYVQNLIAAYKWWASYELNKLGKPVNRDEWDMSPQTYNAYYNPSNNEIVLPAGIFTIPGYADNELDDAIIYGYAGASTIGHEITHGFDDEGRQYDANGNLKNWWTKTDERQFKERADVMVTQFSKMVVVDTFKINGKATLGENLADLGGILLGWDAYTQTAEYKANKSIANLTPTQRYFLGYALGWMGQYRPESLKNLIMTDVHSPAKFRVNGPYMSVDAFYNTFKIPEGSNMFLQQKDRVSVW